MTNFPTSEETIRKEIGRLTSLLAVRYTADGAACIKHADWLLEDLAKSTATTGFMKEWITQTAGEFRRLGQLLQIQERRKSKINDALVISIRHSVIQATWISLQQDPNDCPMCWLDKENLHGFF